MNVQAAIDRLVELRDQLPDRGANTNLRVGLCNQAKMETTGELEIEFWTEISKADGSVREVTVMIIGHPHRDDDSRSMRAWSEDADAKLEEWSNNSD